MSAQGQRLSPAMMTTMAAEVKTADETAAEDKLDDLLLAAHTVLGRLGRSVACSVK